MQDIGIDDIFRIPMSQQHDGFPAEILFAAVLDDICAIQRTRAIQTVANKAERLAAGLGGRKGKSA